MKRGRIVAAFAFAAAASCLGVAGQAQALDYHLIIAGAGGQEPFIAKFTDWPLRMRDVLVKLGHAPDRIMLLTDQGVGDGTPAPMPTTLQAIEDVLEGLETTVTADDTLYIYMIGHGSYLRDDSKLQIAGPDLSAKHLDSLLDAVRPKHLVLINAASASAGWINELSATGRIICTATKSIDEANATEFMEHFLAGLEEASADRNHDERISVLEACQQAAELTAAWYTREGFIATEHALLDDNGDGLGSRLPILPLDNNEFAVETEEGVMPVFDGSVAETIFLKEFLFPDTVPQELVDDYRNTINQIEALKRQKAALDEAEYYNQLETLLIHAATVNREIRALIPPESLDPPAK